MRIVNNFSVMEEKVTRFFSQNLLPVLFLPATVSAYKVGSEKSTLKSWRLKILKTLAYK